MYSLLAHCLKCPCRSLALAHPSPLRCRQPALPRPLRSRHLASVPAPAAVSLTNSLKDTAIAKPLPTDLDSLEASIGQLLAVDALSSQPSSTEHATSVSLGSPPEIVPLPAQQRFSAAEVMNELSKTDLKRPNTAAVGLSFELRTVNVLNSHQPFIVEHCGKSGDQGIDFQGYLTSQSLHSLLTSSATNCSPLALHIRHHPTLVANPNAIPVLGQCKALSRPVSPGQIHGFAAVLAARNLRARTTQPQAPASAPYFLGVFVCEDRGFTKGSRHWVLRECSEPMVLIALRQAGGDDVDAVQDVVMNEVAKRTWPQVTHQSWRVGLDVDVAGSGLAHRLGLCEHDDESAASM
ncbi:hypothetical protein BCR44DRAFT_1067558 [Catenaria anguillulae PL171]|uniref:Uncharacterized protein n=1 Tax=Catenaria anguillulae PL171 TaxID=765915 RepID=A0A1Y2HRH4_9FUNG|nr:hypothetical protein BCR44DRAFT_1067558 [Catenaria anguillulae PL171]